jgi:hypothetical protein
VDPEWRKKLHHRHYRDDTSAAVTAAMTNLGDDEVIHKAGDLFVRAELIQLKSGMDDGATQNKWIYDSRNWVYSKPLWFGEFRGDGWRGVGEKEEHTTWSLFKRMGMSMMHLVSDPEPEGGDAQSFRGIVHGYSPANVNGALDKDGNPIGPGRGVRVRSWKDHFRGWLFIDCPDENKKNPFKVDYPYSLNFERKRAEAGRYGTVSFNDYYLDAERYILHPDLTFNDDEHIKSGGPEGKEGNKWNAPLIDRLKDLEPKHRLNGVWTPPIAIDLTGWALKRTEPLLFSREDYYASKNLKNEETPDFFINANPAYNDGAAFAAGSSAYDEQQNHTSPAGFNKDDIHNVYQWGPTQTEAKRYNSFGQYAYDFQWVNFERRLKKLNAGNKDKDYYTNRYVFGYTGLYTDMLYARLSMLRPDYRQDKDDKGKEVEGYHVKHEKLSKEPVWGLYAIRAWDYQRGVMGMNSNEDEFIYDYQNPLRDQSGTGLDDNVGEARKRLLMVVQGLQLPYQPIRFTVNGADGKAATGNFKSPHETRYIEPVSAGVNDSDVFLRRPAGESSQHHGTKKDYSKYKKDRERIFGIHFWGNARSNNKTDVYENPNRFEIDEVWLGEGFSPLEVVWILGLNQEAGTQFDPTTPAGIKAIAETYSTKIKK